MTVTPLIFFLFNTLPLNTGTPVEEVDLIELNNVWIIDEEEDRVSGDTIYTPRIQFTQILACRFDYSNRNKQGWKSVQYFNCFSNKKDIPPISKVGDTYHFINSQNDDYCIITAKHFRIVDSLYDREEKNREWFDFGSILDFRMYRDSPITPKARAAHLIFLRMHLN